MMSYILLIVVTLAIGFGAQAYVNSQIKKYSLVPNSTRMTGYQVATGMLAYYDVSGVEVRMGGRGQNFFNPKDNSITLNHLTEPLLPLQQPPVMRLVTLVSMPKGILQ